VQKAEHITATNWNNSGNYVYVLLSEKPTGMKYKASMTSIAYNILIRKTNIAFLAATEKDCAGPPSFK
jgi:hypothetical protein